MPAVKLGQFLLGDSVNKGLIIHFTELDVRKHIGDGHYGPVTLHFLSVFPERHLGLVGKDKRIVPNPHVKRNGRSVSRKKAGTRVICTYLLLLVQISAERLIIFSIGL